MKINEDLLPIVINSTKPYNIKDKVWFKKGKNLLPFNTQNFTHKGVHFYIENGSLYLNGTSNAEINRTDGVFKRYFEFILNSGTYTIKKNIIESRPSSHFAAYVVKYDDNSVLAKIADDNSLATFTINERTKIYFTFYVWQQTFDHQTFHFQLEEGISATSYESYIAPSININGDEIYNKSIATPSSDGLMWSWDKYKLDSMSRTEAAGWPGNVMKFSPPMTNYGYYLVIAQTPYGSCSIYTICIRNTGDLDNAKVAGENATFSISNGEVTMTVGSGTNAYWHLSAIYIGTVIGLV